MRRFIVAMLIALPGVPAVAQGPYPREATKTIWTLRGNQEGYAIVRRGEVVYEYIPEWRPNASELADRYHAITNAYNRSVAVPVWTAPVVSTGPGFATIPGTFVTDGMWEATGPGVFAGPVGPGR